MDDVVPPGNREDETDPGEPEMTYFEKGKKASSLRESLYSSLFGEEALLRDIRARQRQEWRSILNDAFWMVMSVAGIIGVVALLAVCIEILWDISAIDVVQVP